MRKIMLFLTAFMVFYSCFAAETDGGNITSVSLYRNGATIKREFTAHLNKGENTIIIKNLPQSADINSFRINPQDTSIRIIGTDTQKTYLNKERDGRVTALKAQADALDTKINKLTDDADTLKNSISFIRGLNPFSQNQKTSQADIDSYIRYMEQIQAQKNDKLSDITASIKVLKDQRDNLQKEIDSITATYGQSFNLMVTATAPTDKDAAFNIAYNINSAGWSPVYEARANSATSKTEITAYASIHQNMGEDWKNVKLDISTLMPTAEALPNVRPWYLDIYKPHPVTKSAYYELSMMPKAMAVPEMEAATEPVPVMAEDTTSFSFALPTRVTVPSDGQPHRIMLRTEIATGDFAYYAAPELSDKAYLTAKIKNPFAFPILAGKMGIYLDDRMVSSAEQTDGVLPGGEMELSLGADESIKIDRKLSKNSGSSGIFGKTERAAYDGEITLVNKKNKDIDISVTEPTPVSRNDQIKVTLGNYTKDGLTIDNDGIITWTLKVKPAQTVKLKLEYKIEYPEDATVTGLK